MATSDTYHDDEPTGTKDEKIVKEAMKRFDICATYENDSRLRFIEDIKFCNADSDNLFQWDSTTRNARGYGTIDERPCLTINKTRQHCLNIINDAKQNKPSVKVKPVGNGATYDAAQVFEGICRHIEYISNAQAAYDTATTFQVQGGIGWFRLETGYPDYNDQLGDDAYNQEIFIKRIKDPLTVFLDPDIREADGSDARYGFVFDDMARKVFKDKYPDDIELDTKSPLDVSGDWLREDQVRVAEYFRVVETKETLVSYKDPMTGQRQTKRKSEMDEAGPDLYKHAIGDPQTKERDILDRKVEWYLIAGDKIIDRSIWAGRYIPLFRVIGEETIIDGQMDRKGHTRAMKDPQRIYNYWSSAAVEFVALQGKTPWIASMQAIENLETYYETANNVNHSVMPYNAFDDAGRPLEKPERAVPPTYSQAYIEGLKLSSQEIKEVSGQFEADLGMEGNEKSGVAIQQRQRQGDNATYHYIDNLALAIRFLGKALIDLIPKIYDTARVIKIMGDDGVEHEVTVDPKAQQAFLQQQAQDADNVKSIFNPSVGRYDVEADVGPAFATRRQEAFMALSQIMKESPDLMKVAGDLLFKAADFPMSDQVAKRIRNTIPEQVISGDGPSPEMQQAQQHIEQMQGLLAQSAQALADEKRKAMDQSEKITLEGKQKEIDEYRAVTDRLKLLMDHGLIDEVEGKRLASEMQLAEHASTLSMLEKSHEAELAHMAPEPEPAPEAANAA